MRLCLILVTHLLRSVCSQEEDWNLWPLFTPLLGVSEPCLEASLEYVTLLNEALTTTEPLTVQQKNAVQMFDSNGRFPFFQEGILQDVVYIDLCDSILKPIPNCQQISDDLRYLRMPFGNANGPGSESSCKAASQAKYCHNYYQYYIPPSTSTNTSTTGHGQKNPKQSLDGFNVNDLLQKTLDVPQVRSDFEPRKTQSNLNLDPSKLVNLYELMVERNSYFSVAHRQLTTLYGNTTMFPEYKDAPIDPNKVVGMLVFLWTTRNFQNGVGQWGYTIPVSYQGMCFPSACSVEDIEINSVIYGVRFLVEGAGIIISSPVVNEGLGQLFLNMTVDQINRASVGCSDDDVYSGEWQSANYIVVTILGIIAVLILIGTVMEMYQDSNNNNGLAYQMLVAFSLKENIRFVFEVPKGAGARFGCLEGMRSLSMCWVILGHHFLFGGQHQHVKNKEYNGQIQGPQKAGGLLFEAVLQGEYSVDSFLFIGATLLSFLLLKDLDKSNGWFSSGAGVVRMILFYVNRYLRITIPYALAMAVFIGVIPLVLKDNMDAGRLAYSEAEQCASTMGYHMAYINIFPDTGGMAACMGQTWYLSCDMLLFLVSPLLIYPLWTGKFGPVRRILSILWWFTVFGASCGFAYWYIFFLID